MPADECQEVAMGRSLRAVLLITFLLGCGGRSADKAGAGFVNQTRHSDGDLWTMWKAAQRSVALKIDLNPVQQAAESAPPEILPGDARALAVLPSQLTVAPEPDVSARTLLAATGIQRADPTGLIACPQPCDVRFTTAYSGYEPETTRYAASWESRGSDFTTILEYEFENHILFALGYDMRWR